MEVFDRQLRIENWSQQAITNTVALCLGVGGLGSSVAMGLARLGVGRIILIDYDIVEIHNLNRQILFSHADVGQPKAEAGKRTLEANHCVSSETQVEAHQFDVVKEWARVVELARRSTVVFNMVDYGDYYDYAVQSLCYQLKLPFIQGGTFGFSFTIDYFSPEGIPCLSCANDTYDKDIIQNLLPEIIEAQTDLTHLPKNDNPVGQSNVYLCSLCSLWMVAILGQRLINDPEIKIPNRLIGYSSSMEMINFAVEPKPGCPICKAPEPPPKEEEKVEENKEENKEESKEQLDFIKDLSDSDESQEAGKGIVVGPDFDIKVPNEPSLPQIQSPKHGNFHFPDEAEDQ